MRSILLAAFLLLVPSLASAQSPGAPSLDLDLELDLPTEQANVKQVQRKTAQAMNPPLKILPLAMGLPMAIAGMSIANTSPIAYGEGLTLISPSMRSAGLGLMGGAFAANVIFNGLARTARLFGGGEWQKDIGFFAAGIGAAIGGYVLISVGTDHSLVLPDGTRQIDAPPVVGALLAGGSVAWTVGSLLLIIDATNTAHENVDLLARTGRAGPRFAGFGVAPVIGLEGPEGASASIALTW